MKLFRTIRRDYHALRRGAPGKRFRDHIRQRRGRRVSSGRAFNLTVGLLLITAGLAIGWLPGPGGFLALVGLVLIAQEIPVIAKALDRTEIWMHRAIAAGKRKLQHWRSSAGTKT